MRKLGEKVWFHDWTSVPIAAVQREGHLAHKQPVQDLGKPEEEDVAIECTEGLIATGIRCAHSVLDARQELVVAGTAARYLQLGVLDARAVSGGRGERSRR